MGLQDVERNQTKRVVAGVSDLFFASKIAETAKHVGMQVEFAGSAEVLLAKAANAPACIIVDLNQQNLGPIALIRKIKADPALAGVPLSAFVNHECTDLIEEAKRAGSDEVLTRGAFSQSLPELLGRVS